MVLMVLLKIGAKDFTVKRAEGEAKLPPLGPGGHLLLVLLRKERVEVGRLPRVLSERQKKIWSKFSTKKKEILPYIVFVFLLIFKLQFFPKKINCKKLNFNT